MSGRIVYRPQPPHRCSPPMIRDRSVSEPAEPVGTVWECDCGERWEVKVDRHPEWVRLKRAALDKGDNT